MEAASRDRPDSTSTREGVKRRPAVLRITGGRYRGTTLQSFRGRDIRPTASRTREAAFNILATVEGSCGLDLFCGAGTFALEAISRGAARVVLVDRSRAALAVARRNAAKLGVEAQVVLVRRDLGRGLPPQGRTHAPFDWVYLDPPYDLLADPQGPVHEVLRAVCDPGLLAPGAAVILEHRAGTFGGSDEGRLRLRGIRRYGDTGLAFFEAVDDPSEPTAP
jgi:16S rRNA (guanine966-N2)-methyltransferase